MKKPGPARDIDAEAAGWALAIEGLEDAFPPELTAWLAEDPRRDGMLLRAQAALDLVDRAAAVYGAAPETAPPPPAFSRRAIMGAAGAGIAAATVGAFGLWSQRPDTFETRKGEIRRVPLTDGSLIAINTQSRLAVSMKRKARTVDLRQGEAWFEVARDPDRPFVVAVGEVRVRAVGTAFSVRRLGGRAQVMVTEGVVELFPSGGPRSPVRVAAGSMILFDPERENAPEPAAMMIERHLAWRIGQIVLDGQSLSEAATEFNRYNQRRIVVEDPSLGAQRFVGVFQLNEPESFAKAVAASADARIAMNGDLIRLGYR